MFILVISKTFFHIHSFDILRRPKFHSFFTSVVSEISDKQTEPFLKFKAPTVNIVVDHFTSGHRNHFVSSS